MFQLDVEIVPKTIWHCDMKRMDEQGIQGGHTSDNELVFHLWQKSQGSTKELY